MPTRTVEVQTILPSGIARRQELSLAALQLHLANLKDLCEHPAVQGNHQLQLMEACVHLQECIDFLGPVQDGPVDEAVQQDELDEFLSDTQKLRILSVK